MNLPISRELTKPRPLLGLAVATMAGILIADQLPSSWTWLHWPLLATASGFALFFLIAIRHWFALLPLFLVLGMTYHAWKLDVTRDHPWRSWLEQKNEASWVEVEGDVEQPFRRSLPGFDPGEALFRVSTIIDKGSDAPLSRAHPAYFSLRLPSSETLPAGHYRLTGWMKLPPPADNPGQFNKRQYDLRLGLIGQIEVAHLIESHPSRWDFSSQLIQTSEKCRDWISNALNRHLPENAPQNIVLMAMTLGATDTATPEIQLPFRLSGTLHIFAVSGLHVAIIGMIFWFILRCAGVSRGKQPIILIPILFIYIFITGIPPSAMRSAFMASILLLGMMGNRRADLLNSLGAAALLLFAFDTNQLFQAGFQLSFGVLAGIAVFSNLIKFLFQKWEEPDPFLPKNLLTLWQQWMWAVRRFCVGTICVSIAAWFGSLPLMLYHFHTITPIGLLANLILVPWSTVVLSLAVIRLALAAIAIPFLQTGFALLSYYAASITLWTAQFFAHIPYGHIYIPSLDNFPRPAGQLTVLRPGGADGVNHLRLNDYHWLLDCGSLRQFPFVLQPYLHHQGINRLDHLLISHADTAHQAAAPVLRSHYHLKHIYAPISAPKKTQLSELSWDVVHAPMSLPLASQKSQPEAHLEVLFPPQDWFATKADDRALIARIIIDGFRILWCNDAGFLAEKHLLETLNSEELQADLIIRNQHESDHSMLPEFLLAVSPKAIISSHSDFPIEQQISPALRQQCLRQGILHYDQSRCGAVTLNFWSDKLQIVPYRGNLPVFTILSKANLNPSPQESSFSAAPVQRSTPSPLPLSPQE